MMSGLRLGRVFGIEVDVHPSWLVIALLLTWSLASGMLPAELPAMGAGTRYLLAGILAVLFFASLLAHELAHSLVALARGIPVDGITFFLFGGMARAARDSRSPGEEFIIAIAGPGCSFLLASLFFGLWWLGGTAGWPAPLTVGLGYLWALNLVLAVFNMLPGFPMDGGRVLRAVLWKATGDVTRATRWAARVGVWMALILMAVGVWLLVAGDVIGGIWLVLIGLFIRHAARTSYRHHMIGRLQELAARWTNAPGSGAAQGGAGLGAPGAGLPGPGLPGPGRDITHLRTGEV